MRRRVAEPPGISLVWVATKEEAGEAAGELAAAASSRVGAPLAPLRVAVCWLHVLQPRHVPLHPLAPHASAFPLSMSYPSHWLPPQSSDDQLLRLQHRLLRLRGFSGHQTSYHSWRA